MVWPGVWPLLPGRLSCSTLLCQFVVMGLAAQLAFAIGGVSLIPIAARAYSIRRVEGARSSWTRW